MTHLLDVNVLLALVDPASVHHERAHSWVGKNKVGFAWASCALTENGFCRVLSSSSYPGNVKPAIAVRILSGLREDLPGHRFWPCSLSLTEESRFQWDLVQGAKQLTDLYLLALAVRQRSRFVTFDQRIRWAAIRGANAETVETL